MIEKISDDCEQRRIQMLGNGECDQIIDELLREYQEIFADIAAKSILEFESDDYFMAFNISEGYKVQEDYISQKDYNRRRVLQEVAFGKDKSDEECTPFHEEQYSADYWTHLDIVRMYMNEYASECQKELDARLCHVCDPELLSQVRKAMHIFSSMDYSCKEIYDFIDEKAEEYAETIDKRMKGSEKVETKSTRRCI